MNILHLSFSRDEDGLGASAQLTISTELDISHEQALEALIAAITDWINETQDGKDVFHASSGDLNIGDMASYSAFDETLQPFLQRHGIAAAVLVEAPDTYQVEYDRHLFNYNALENIDG